MYHVASLAATETFTYTFRRRYVERRGLFVVERTQANIVDSALAKGNEFRHHINYVCSVKNLLYGELVYHSGSGRNRCQNYKKNNVPVPVSESCALFK